MRRADSIAERQGEWEMKCLIWQTFSSSRQLKFLQDCTGFKCTFRLHSSQERRFEEQCIIPCRLCSGSIACPAREAKCRGLGVAFPSFKTLPSDWQSEIQSYALPRETYCGEKRGRARKAKCAREIGPSERFIGSNEDVGGVQVVVLWLRPVSIMDLASQLAIDCTAHDLVCLLFFTLPVCQPATQRRRAKQNLLADDRYSVQMLSHYPKGGLRWGEEEGEVWLHISDQSNLKRKTQKQQFVRMRLLTISIQLSCLF